MCEHVCVCACERMCACEHVCVCVGGMENSKETRPASHNSVDAHKNSKTVAACTGPAQIQT